VTVPLDQNHGLAGLACQGGSFKVAKGQQVHPFGRERAPLEELDSEGVLAVHPLALRIVNKSRVDRENPPVESSYEILFDVLPP